MGKLSMKKAQSLEWHEECLRNMERSLNEDWEKVTRLTARCNELQEKINQYKYQIESARKDGRDGFDRNRYKVA